VRLEALGFSAVYEYAGGKKDWVSEGMPVEGERAGEARSGDIARIDPPTCLPDASIEDLQGRADITEWGLCVVTDEQDIVHGLLTGADIERSPGEARVDHVMDPAPSTRRPDTSIPKMLDRLTEKQRDSVLVTTSRGRLLGVLFLEDIRRHLGKPTDIAGEQSASRR
jgi:CBS domain-containing protein